MGGDSADCFEAQLTLVDTSDQEDPDLCPCTALRLSQRLGLYRARAARVLIMERPRADLS